MQDFLMAIYHNQILPYLALPFQIPTHMTGNRQLFTLLSGEKEIFRSKFDAYIYGYDASHLS